MPFTYPAARRSDTAEDYHGTEVPDPYRWLEDPHSEETRSFVSAQNNLTLPYLGSLPEVNQLKERMRELWDTPRTGAPRERNGVVVWAHNDGLQPQPVFYVRRRGSSEPEILIDPNEFSDDGAVAIVQWSLSPDGEYFAYSVAEAGSDRQTIRIRRTVDATDLSDELRHLRFTTVAWHDDGFFYARFPEVPEGSVSVFKDIAVYLHLVGTEQDEDTLVFDNPDEPELLYAPVVSDDGRFLILFEFEGTARENGLLYRPVDAEAPFTRLVERGIASHGFLTHRDGRFLVHTNLDAPNGRIAAIALDDPTHYTDVVAESEHAIEIAGAAAGLLVVIRLREACHVVDLFTLEGDDAGSIPLPDLGSVAEMTGDMAEPAIYLGFQSFLFPPTALRWVDGNVDLFAGAQPPLNPATISVERHHAISSDGAQVGMFVLRAVDATLPAPTVLYGYGGYTINLTPTFTPARLAWLEKGGVIVVANLRGGAEHGEQWHRQGMLDRKQQTFDDFFACAEHVIDVGITTNAMLGTRGGSNGGLLTAATMIQRPAFFGAVVAQVPVTDMYRYHHFTAGRYWTVEFGNAEQDPEAFRYLSAYSPLHNVDPAVDYPPILITTAETDDRVVPMHSLKFAAELQHAAGGQSENPLLVRVETRAGHGLGKPTDKLIEEAADMFGFLLHHLS